MLVAIQPKRISNSIVDDLRIISKRRTEQKGVTTETRGYCPIPYRLQDNS